MQTKAIIIAALLYGLAGAAPTAGKKNTAITKEEYAKLRDNGLKVRDELPVITTRSAKKKNTPISKEEYAKLRDAGVKVRGESSHDLTVRDKTMNCGHLVTGSGGSNGHGKWIPVKQFAKAADEFCNAYVGTDIANGHETSDEYGITFSNGDSGNIIFAIYNLYKKGSYPVDHGTCLKAMQAPLGSNQVKPNKREIDGVEHIQLQKRDDCYGKKHGDYEGGYYQVDGIGAFGSELYPA